MKWIRMEWQWLGWNRTAQLTAPRFLACVLRLSAGSFAQLLSKRARSRAVVLIGCDFTPMITGGVCQGHRCGPNVIIWLTAKVESLTRLVPP